MKYVYPKLLKKNSDDKFSNFLKVIEEVLDGRPPYKNDHYIQRQFEKIEDHSYEMLKEENGFIFRFEVPGYLPENIDITIEDGFLLVKGKKETPKVLNNSCFSSYSFSKRILLPKGFNKDKITATLNNGILSLSVPAPEPEKKPKTTKISITTTA